MTSTTTGYFTRLMAALRGRDISAAAPDASDTDGAEAAASIASLKMDLKDRDELIAQMRVEYETLECAKERTTTEAGQEGVEKLLKRISGPLATLVGLTSMAEAGDEVELGDLVQLVHDLEKAFARAGLARIGDVGQEAEFDVAGHQRMSGGRVTPGTPVTVRLPGYRLGQKVLVKAMVSAEGQDDG